MSIFGKVAVGVALVLPLGAYFTGTMVAGEPAPQPSTPIVMDVSAEIDESPEGAEGRQQKGQQQRGAGAEEKSTRGPEVITPVPQDLEDDDAPGPGRQEPPAAADRRGGGDADDDDDDDDDDWDDDTGDDTGDDDDDTED